MRPPPGHPRLYRFPIPFRMPLRALLIALSFLVAAGCAPTPRAGAPAGEEVYRPVRDPARIPQQPYHRYTTVDRLGRTITFYLSEEPPGTPPLPLLVYVQGSSTRSHFVERGGRIGGEHGHAFIADVVRGRARLLLVEKPGVRYLDDPADAGGAGASATFRAEHTLARWAEAVHAATRAARQLDAVDARRVLVAGHSEGGVVAARLAAQQPYVTHVAVLAGEGPTPLYSLMALARRGVFFRHVADDPEARVRYVQAAWARIRAAPEAADSLFFGHTYRRWHSFLSTSPLEELSQAEAPVYLATGTADEAVTVASFDVLCAHLLSKGREVVCDRVDGADHSFALAGGAQDGWSALWTRVLDWYLAGPPPGAP